MNVIIADYEYTFDASAKEITLLAPYSALDVANIVRILNITTHSMIYDCDRAGYPISITAGVITHTSGLADMTDSDELQIIVGVPAKSTEGVQDWTAVAQNAMSKSAECDLSGVGSAVLHIQAALDTTTAHTGTQFIVQGSGSDTGNADWHTIAPFVALIGTAATDAIEDAPLAAGSTAIKLTGHALTVLSKWLFIKDGTLANSELVFESAQTANEVVVLDGTENAHIATTAIWNVAMEQIVIIPFAIKRVRLVVDNTYDDNGSTLNYKLRVSKATGI